MNRVETQLRDLMSRRILIKDGAMGTMFQAEGLSESDFRGDRFASHAHPLKGDNDLLVLTQPGLVVDVHERFLAAGADLLGTASFNGNAISQADYGLAEVAREISRESARLARLAADKWSDQTPDKPRFVAGSIGPTNRTLSLSPDVNNPGYRAVTWDELESAYADQVRGHDETDRTENIVRHNPKVIPSRTDHPTPKPVALAEWFLNLHTKPGDLVLDAFNGGGSTAMACQRLGRRYIGVEMDLRWCELSVQRLRGQTLPIPFWEAV